MWYCTERYSVSLSIQPCSSAGDRLKERTSFSGCREGSAALLEADRSLVMFAGLVKKSLTLPPPIFSAVSWTTLKRSWGWVLDLENSTSVRRGISFHTISRCFSICQRCLTAAVFTGDDENILLNCIMVFT